MLFKPVILLISLYFNLTFEKENTSEIINLVNDFTIKLNHPSKVIAHVCWTKDMRIHLWKEFSKNSFSSRVSGLESFLHYAPAGEHTFFLLDGQCDDVKNILNQADKLQLFNQPFKWLIWGVTNESLFDNLYFGVDSKVFVVEKNSIEYIIQSLYKPSKDSNDFVKDYITTWTSNQGFLHFNDYSAPQNRTDLKGTPITISHVITNPDTHQHLWDYRDSHIDSISKLNYILVYHLMTMVNGRSVEMFQTTWGYKNATTSLYSGLIGDLQTGQAELGGTPSFFTIDRIDIVDYIAATTPTFMKFIFRAPPLTYVTNVFTLPFDTYVWYCSFILIAAILVVVYIIVMWEWRDPIFSKRMDTLHALRPTILDVFLMEIGAITQQGTDAEPKSNAGRIATIFTFIALMFMYTSYSANIVALLQSTTESIRTLEDLLTSRITLGVEEIVYAHYYFENAREPVRRAIYNQKVAPKGQKANFMTVEEGMKKVQQGFFAFHVELSRGYKVVADVFQENEKCALKEIEFVNLIEPWLSVKKKSPYKEIFKVGMKKIHESGIQRREINRIYTKKPVCHSKGSNFGSAGIIDCYAAFLIFGIGVGCSIILLLLELLIKTYRKNNALLIVQSYDE